MAPKDFSELINLYPGSLFIHINKNCTNHEQFSFFSSTETNYIYCVQWISPYYSLIIDSKEVSWIQWDSTFYSISPYALTIPCAIIQKTVVPLGFSFGPSESTKLYSDLMNQMNEKKNKNSIPTLIDMGKSLISFANIFNLITYFCHCHIIESFGSNSIFCKL